MMCEVKTVIQPHARIPRHSWTRDLRIASFLSAYETCALPTELMWPPPHHPPPFPHPTSNPLSFRPSLKQHILPPHPQIIIRPPFETQTSKQPIPKSCTPFQCRNSPENSEKQNSKTTGCRLFSYQFPKLLRSSYIYADFTTTSGPWWCSWSPTNTRIGFKVLAHIHSRLRFGWLYVQLVSRCDTVTAQYTLLCIQIQQCGFHRRCRICVHGGTFSPDFHPKQ